MFARLVLRRARDEKASLADGEREDENGDADARGR
jgi:hypothetical protein